MTVKIFRWKAIGPLLLFFTILGVLVWIFAEPVAKDTTEEASTELLGTQVDVGKLDLFPKAGRRRSAGHPGGRSLCPHPQSPRSRRDPAEAQPIRTGREEARHREPQPARHALRHHPKAPREGREGGWLRASDLPLGGAVDQAVRRTAALAHPDRYHSPARPGPHPAHHHQGGPGAARANRLDAKGAGAGAAATQYQCDGRFGSGPGSAAGGHRSPKSSAWTAPVRRSSRCSRPSGSSTRPRSGSKPWSETPRPGCSLWGRGYSCSIRLGKRTSPSPSLCSSCRASRRPTSAVHSSAR